jgi:large subunit ribosomal protein L19
MSQELLRKASESSLKADAPRFRVGDTVEVSVKIVEGDKERLQPFRGVVIARQGAGVQETFTVRRIVNNEGVERTFPVHSPQVAGVKVLSSGVVRRSKLYFLRKRVGKATRLREIAQPGRKGGKKAAPAKPAAAAATEASPAEPAATEGEEA